MNTNNIHATDDARKIHYRLVEIPNRDGERECYAARACITPMSLRAIAQQMVREGSKFAQHEILSMAEQMIDVITDQLRNGHSVNFGSMMHFRPSIKGRFDTEDEAFNPSKHELLVSVSVGRGLRSALKDVKPELLSGPSHPEMRAVSITPSEQTNLIRITGKHLYYKELGETANWFIRIDNKLNPVTPIFQKPNGREVLFTLPTATYPVGTEAAFILRLSRSNSSMDYASATFTL